MTVSAAVAERLPELAVMVTAPPSAPLAVNVPLPPMLPTAGLVALHTAEASGPLLPSEYLASAWKIRPAVDPAVTFSVAAGGVTEMDTTLPWLIPPPSPRPPPSPPAPMAPPVLDAPPPVPPLPVVVPPAVLETLALLAPHATMQTGTTRARRGRRISNHFMNGACFR